MDDAVLLKYRGRWSMMKDAWSWVMSCDYTSSRTILYRADSS